jgi:hypothetical protein
MRFGMGCFERRGSRCRMFRTLPNQPFQAVPVSSLYTALFDHRMALTRVGTVAVRAAGAFSSRLGGASR